MFILAWRQLHYEKERALLTAVALGAIIAVILVLEGFEQGQYFQLKQIVLKRGADLIATQSGVTNFIAVRSSIPQMVRKDVEDVPGVIEAHPITAVPIIYNKNNVRTPVYVLVYDTKGGPSNIILGNTNKDGRDIVIDYSLAKKYHLKPGDPFDVTDFEFRISGITEEAAFMMPFAFINYDGMIDLFLESQIAPDLSTFPLLSYMLIELDDQSDPVQVARTIEEQVPPVDVITPEQLAGNDVSMGKVFYKPIMGLLVTIGYIIGLLVVGLIMYAEIRGRIKNFAVLKALGFPFHKLILGVVVQSLLMLMIAIPIGILFAAGISEYIETIAPVYLIRLFEGVVFTHTLSACLVFAFLGSLIPLHIIRGSDPMMAFQGA